MSIYLFDVLSNIGAAEYIAQKNRLKPTELHLAWSLAAVSKLGLWLILLIAIPFIDAIYTDMPLSNLLYVASLALPINALRSPVEHYWKRRLTYKPLFKLAVSQKVLSFGAVMLFVAWQPSVWALVIGDLVAALSFVVGSYYLHRFRPRFRLAGVRQMWLFSRWLMAKNLLGYTRSQVDTFLVSVLFPAADLGRYYLCRDIAMLPGQNLLVPATQPLLAAFSQRQNHKDGLFWQLNLALIASCLLTLPIVGFVVVFPELLVNALLGEQWQGSGTLLAAMAPLILYLPLLLVHEQVLISLGKVKSAFGLDVLSLLVVSLGLLLAYPLALEQFALLRGLLGVAVLLVVIGLVYRRLHFTPGSWLLAALGISLFTALSAWLVLQTPFVSLPNPALALLTSGGLFCLLVGLCCVTTITLLAAHNPYAAHFNQHYLLPIIRRCR